MATGSCERGPGTTALAGAGGEGDAAPPGELEPAPWALRVLCAWELGAGSAPLACGLLALGWVGPGLLLPALGAPAAGRSLNPGRSRRSEAGGPAGG